MIQYLLIETTHTANPELQRKLSGPDSELLQTTDPDEVNFYLSSGSIKGIFVRIELWDHRLFSQAIINNTMPELVLLGRPEQQLKGCCGFGLPEFLADDCTDRDVESAIRIMNNNFMQAMDFRFVLAVADGGKWFKLDISRMEQLGIGDEEEGVLIEASCGEFWWNGRLEELQGMIK